MNTLVNFIVVVTLVPTILVASFIITAYIMGAVDVVAKKFKRK